MRAAVSAVSADEKGSSAAVAMAAAVSAATAAAAAALERTEGLPRWKLKGKSCYAQEIGWFGWQRGEEGVSG